MRNKSTLALILSVVSISLLVFVCAVDKDRAETNIAETQRINANPRIYAPPLPDSMTFAGETVPLDVYYVREGLDREMIVNTFGHTSTMLYFKRAHRYFPVIEPILKRNGVPADFKYLCVIESGLTNATSPAKAQGFWQFMKATGQKYGLEVSDEIDMRNNVEAATEAAEAAHGRTVTSTSACAGAGGSLCEDRDREGDRRCATEEMTEFHFVNSL